MSVSSSQSTVIAPSLTRSLSWLHECSHLLPHPHSSSHNTRRRSANSLATAPPVRSISIHPRPRTVQYSFVLHFPHCSLWSGADGRHYASKVVQTGGRGLFYSLTRTSACVLSPVLTPSHIHTHQPCPPLTERYSF